MDVADQELWEISVIATNRRDIDKNGHITTADLGLVRASAVAGRVLRLITIPAQSRMKKERLDLLALLKDEGESIVVSEDGFGFPGAPRDLVRKIGKTSFIPSRPTALVLLA